MLEVLKKLSKKPDLVFVGGVALVMHGLKEKATDIDIVVTSLDGLDGVIEYETDSKFSFTGKRGFIPGKIKVDIFIEDELPEYKIYHNNFKCETIEAMVEYYKKIYPLVDKYWKNAIQKKLKLLE